MATEGQEKDRLSWDDPELQATQPRYDPDADAQAFALPPDDRDWRVKLKLGEKGVYPKKPASDSRVKDIFLVCEVAMEIADPSEPKYDGLRIGSEYVNSIYSERTGTSSLVNMLRVAGDKPKPGLDLKPLAEWTEKALGNEPIVTARFEWQWYSKDVQNAANNPDDSDHAQWKGCKDGVFKKGMRNAKQNDDGSFDPVLPDPISGSDVSARLKWKKWVAS